MNMSINALFYFNQVGMLASKSLLPLHSLHFDTVLITSWIFGEGSHVIEEVQIHAEDLLMN